MMDATGSSSSSTRAASCFHEMEESLLHNTRTRPLYMCGTSWMRPTTARHPQELENDNDGDKGFSKQPCAEAAAARVLNALGFNTSVKKFILQNAEMSMPLSKAVESSLARNQTLTSITLKKLTTDSSYFQIPSSVFVNNLQLQSIHLTQVRLDGQACQCLALLIQESKALATLVLNDVRMDPCGLPFLFNALTVSSSLEKLHLVKLSWDMETIGILLAALTVNRSIQHLALEGLQLDESHTIESTPNASLSESVSSLTDLVRHNQVLTTLSLRNNQLTALALERMLPSLETNPSLRKLYLSRNPLGDDSVPLILRLWRNNQPKSDGPKVARLSLSDLCLVNTQLSAVACATLARHLHTCTLTHLHLDGNDVQDAAIYLLQALQYRNTTLYTILDRIPRRWGPLWKEVEFHLRANQAGRKVLLDNHHHSPNLSLQLAPKLLAGTRSQADVLYLLLQTSSPLLWSDL